MTEKSLPEYLLSPVSVKRWAGDEAGVYLFKKKNAVLGLGLGLRLGLGLGTLTLTLTPKQLSLKKKKKDKFRSWPRPRPRPRLRPRPRVLLSLLSPNRCHKLLAFEGVSFT